MLMYSRYLHQKNFKFKRKHQQYGSGFQAIFPFLMTTTKGIKVLQTAKILNLDGLWVVLSEKKTNFEEKY